MKRLLLLCVLLLLITSQGWAQCPPANTFTVSTTVASCPSNGVIQISHPDDAPVTGGVGLSGALYTITAGPASGGYQTTGQSANQFEGLPPGTYTVTISKPGCPDVVKNGIVVGSTYSPLTLSASVGNLCANGQPGGTITTVASGGKAPLEYAFVQSGDVNQDDGTLTYGPSSSTTVAAFGAYVVRVRDACGAFVTRTVTVSPTYSRAYFNPAGSNKDCNTYAINGSLNPTAGGGSITPSASGAYTIELYDVNTTNPCSIPTGAAPFQTITADNATDLRFDLDKSHALIVVRTISPCGEVDVRCFNLGTSIGPAVSSLLAPSCTQLNGINEENMLLQLSRFTPPTSVTITSRASGTPVLLTDVLNSNTSKLYTVPYVAEGYLVQLLDACNQARTLTISNPPSANAAVSVSVSTSRSCANQAGAKRTNVTLSGGITGLLESGAKVVLVSGPSGAISPARQADGGSSASYYWNNLDPGTYTGQIVTPVSGCGPTSFTFTVPANSAANPGLSFALTGTVTQLCGGNANLSTSFNYNGPNSVTYVTTQSDNSVVATNTTGFFGNLAPGVYTVKATANTGCSFTFTQTQSFTLTQADPEPVIEKKLGVVCENGGKPTTTGQAYFELAGFPPFRLERRLTGTAAWSTIVSGLTSTTFTASGLSANSTYDFRLTDNCGKSVVTTVSIKPLDAQQVENTLQPCVNAPYTLSVPELTGANYSWTKDGQWIASGRQIEFSPYQAANDGVYVATISLGNGCLVREAKVTLNSVQCNQPLPVHLRTFSVAVQDNQTVKIAWETSWEQQNAYFQLQRSKDLVSFETIAQIQPREGAESGSQYSYIDVAPYWGTSYYRLQQVDRGGQLTTFPAKSVVLRGEAYGIYPNPVTDARFTLSLDEPEVARVDLYTAEGRSLPLKRSLLSTSQVSLQLPPATPSGVYLLLVEERGHQKSYRLVVRNQ